MKCVSPGCDGLVVCDAALFVLCDIAQVPVRFHVGTRDRAASKADIAPLSGVRLGDVSDDKLAAQKSDVFYTQAGCQDALVSTWP